MNRIHAIVFVAALPCATLCACATGTSTPDPDNVSTSALVDDQPVSPGDAVEPPSGDGVDPPTGDAAEAPTTSQSHTEDLARLDVWLRARHTEDLPDASALATLHDAEAALLAFEATAERMSDRTRALSLLRHAPGESARERLLAVANDDAEHVAARAAAIDGLAGVDPNNDPDVRAAVDAAASHDDPRMQAAATRARDAW